MKIAALSWVLLPLAVGAGAQTPNLIANIPNRTTQSLNGQWRIIVDPYEYGLYDSRMNISKDGYFLNQKPRDKSARVEYDFDTSPQLSVPGDWNSQMEKLFFYEGTVWYRQMFDYQSKPGTRAWLHFGAVNYLASVWLNGQKLGDHTGGFTPFDFEISDKVKPTGNFVVVKVDNTRRKDAVPTTNTDWWNYGGITRGVSVVQVADTFVQDYSIQLKKGSTNAIAGWVRLNGARLKQKVTISIPEAGLSTSVTTDEKGYADLNLMGNLKLWSPEQPKLYDVVIAAEADTVHDQIGFRSVEVRGLDILLNGKPVFLRGISIHEEAPFRGGRAFSQEDARTLLGWAKELGCNFVRLAHYPHNEFMLREADRMGLMVWSESPVYWSIEWENPATLANARNQLAESITRDRNRASVILWSVANETPVGAARNDFLRGLVRQVREMDPTRLVTAAMLHHADTSPTQDRVDLIDDPLGAELDVLGCNEYLGWYDGPPSKADVTEWKSIYQKPLIMSEFGGDALFGLHGDAMTRWTEEYQENIFQHQVAMLNRIPFLRGTSPWILMDFRSPRRTLPNIQDYFNRKGLVSLRGEKKKAFFVMQEFYRQKAGSQ